MVDENMATCLNFHSHTHTHRYNISNTCFLIITIIHIYIYTTVGSQYVSYELVNYLLTRALLDYKQYIDTKNSLITGKNIIVRIIYKDKLFYNKIHKFYSTI